MSQNEDDVTEVKNKELWRLQERDYLLTCIENAGIDNWDGLEYAYEEFHKVFPDD